MRDRTCEAYQVIPVQVGQEVHDSKAPEDDCVELQHCSLVDHGVNGRGLHGDTGGHRALAGVFFFEVLGSHRMRILSEYFLVLLMLKMYATTGPRSAGERRRLSAIKKKFLDSIHVVILGIEFQRRISK